MVNLRIRISRAFGTKLPDAPILAMLIIQEIHQGVEGVAIRSFGEVNGGTGSGNHWGVKERPCQHDNKEIKTEQSKLTVICYIAQIQIRLGMLQPRTGNDLPQNRGLPER